ncbi:MAG TPA: ImmA/IrrE family metallo-endopeptidase [Allosphingosinicella sp.]
MRGFKSRADRIALEVREKVGLTPTDTLDVQAVCDHMEITVIKMTDLPCDVSELCDNDNDCFSAMLVYAGMRLAIVHNDTHHPHRQRSNICHELSHCFLGHKACHLVNDNGARVHDGDIEAEANYLAGSLLLPREAAVHVLANGLISQARAIYGVSRPMLDYRLRITGAYKIYERSLQRRVA